MSKIIFVTGGARSGKSTFAEKLARDITSEKKAYIATAQIFDEEMEYRVQSHKKRRGDEWKTFEAAFHAEIAINEAGQRFDVILFDCITIYLSNFICKFDSLEDIHLINSELKVTVDKLIEAAKNFHGTIIFVSNEVGAGIVPENKLARIYRDCAGIANQMLAAQADEVYFVVSGIPLNIKKFNIMDTFKEQIENKISNKQI